MKNVVILISGRGSSFEEGYSQTSRAEQWEGFGSARIATVISNRPFAKGLETARRENRRVAVDACTLTPTHESLAWQRDKWRVLSPPISKTSFLCLIVFLLPAVSLKKENSLKTPCLWYQF